MYTGGYAGKILRIDLSNKNSREEPLSEEMARDFIGGAGFGITVLIDELKPGIDPLEPDDKLIFAPGPCYSRYCERISLFNIFPWGFFGRSSTSSIDLGDL